MGVILIDAIMVGITVTESGPVFANAIDGTGWVIPLSWALQVMPVFFVIGGSCGILVYRRQRRSGGTAAGFVAARVYRLLWPALLAFGIVGIGLALLSLFGVPA